MLATLMTGSRRIQDRFAKLTQQGRKGFVAYITAGDPSPDATKGILNALADAEVDVIELGIPFSDPLADGPTIQAASGRALAAGMTVRKALDLVHDFRATHDTPLVLFTYLNPVFAYGFPRFLQDATEAGADGLLILDLPPEEAIQNQDLATLGGLNSIRLISPTTPPTRMGDICSEATGFIYYVSREGVTGEQAELSDSIASQVAEIKKHTNVPVAVGFGISSPAQVSTVVAASDAAVVGSAIVRFIAENATQPDLAKRVETFVRPLVEAAHSAPVA